MMSWGSDCEQSGHPREILGKIKLALVVTLGARPVAAIEFPYAGRRNLKSHVRFLVSHRRNNFNKPLSLSPSLRHFVSEPVLCLWSSFCIQLTEVILSIAVRDSPPLLSLP